MRFRKYARYEFTDTPRKRHALARKQRLEREALPLFADVVAADQPDADQVMAARLAKSLEVEQMTRDRRAADWVRARRRLASFGGNAAAVLLAGWNRAPYPADPVYLLMFLHSFDQGRFTLEAMPWDRAHWQKASS